MESVSLRSDKVHLITLSSTEARERKQTRDWIQAASYCYLQGYQTVISAL